MRRTGCSIGGRTRASLFEGRPERKTGAANVARDELVNSGMPRAGRLLRTSGRFVPTSMWLVPTCCVPTLSFAIKGANSIDRVAIHGIARALGLQSAGISSGEGPLVGIAFREARSAGFSFGEGESAGFSFREARQTVFRQNRPRQTENQQIRPRQTEFRERGPRQAENRQNLPRQTRYRQEPPAPNAKASEA